jgi:hypothetical protein
MEFLRTSNLSQQQISRTSPRVSLTTRDTPEGIKVSVYTGERTKKGIVDATAKIIAAFPGWSKEQSEILKDRFAENGFTDERMMDSINHVIDTFSGYGKIPNIANFIQFDKQYTAYTIQQKNSIVQKGIHTHEDFVIVRIEGMSACKGAGRNILFVLRTEAERYKLPTREPLYAWEDWRD